MPRSRLLPRAGQAGAVWPQAAPPGSRPASTLTPCSPPPLGSDFTFRSLRLELVSHCLDSSERPLSKGQGEGTAGRQHSPARPPDPPRTSSQGGAAPRGQTSSLPRGEHSAHLYFCSA